MDLSRLEAYCEANGMPLGPEQMDGFVQFAETLYRLNEVVNLTRVPREDCEVRHFIDSLLVAEFVPHGSRVADLGTGPGLPAWPLACARPDLVVTAVDSNGKMLRVLEQNPLSNLTVVHARGEEFDQRESFDVVTGRALAPLSVQLELSAPLCALGGAVIPFRTPHEDYSLNEKHLGLVLEDVFHCELPDSDVVRSFPVFRKARHTPPQYPRKWAQIKKKPLG